MNYRVHYVNLPAQSIFGMVGRSGGGYNTVWSDWSKPGRAARDAIMREYEQQLDALCGHYRQLEVSILAEGVRNPLIVTCGHPRKRKLECLPPELLAQPPNQLLLLEASTGGSRLHVCQKHNLTVPCIVNDWTGRFSDHPELTTEQEIRALYRDQPQSIVFHHNHGVIESFDQTKVGYHLGNEWSEDRLMPLRAPMWVKIMNQHGYRVSRLPPHVVEVLAQAGVDQSKVSVARKF